MERPGPDVHLIRRARISTWMLSMNLPVAPRARISAFLFQGFRGATTTNGGGRAVGLAHDGNGQVLLRSSRAAWVLGGVRLIFFFFNQLRMRLAIPGPRRNQIASVARFITCRISCP